MVDGMIDRMTDWMNAVLNDGWQFDLKSMTDGRLMKQ